MELIMLTVPDCPNAAALEERLAAVLADYPDAVVRRRQVADEQEAAETGMAGSPLFFHCRRSPGDGVGWPSASACSSARRKSSTEGAPASRPAASR